MSWLIALLACVAAGEAPPPPPPAPAYEIEARFGPEPDTLSAEVEIEIARERVGAEYRFLLGRTFNIISAAARGADIVVENTEQPFPNALQAIIVRPRANAGEMIRVRIRYQGRLVTLQQPPINSINESLVELTVDSMWLPFPQEFNVGLTANARIRGLPRDATIVSTGAVTRRGRVVLIKLTQPNDLALIASRSLREIQEGQFALFTTDPDGAVAQIYRQHGPQGIAALEGWLGPIPGGAGRAIIVRRESRAGYSRPGYYVVSERPNVESAPAAAMDLVHEIAHTWWSKGNFLNEDYWLVEGPADYYAHRYGVEQFGQGIVQPYLDNAARRASRSQALNGVRPNSDTAYAKGELMLVSLEREIGRELFDRFMRDFVDETAHTTRGFVDMLAGYVGAERAARFEARLRAPGFEAQ